MDAARTTVLAGAAGLGGQIPRYVFLGNMMPRGQKLGQEIQPVLWKCNG